MYEQFKRELPYRLLDTSKYPPEVAGRFNSFITTQFDDSLSVEMQMRSIIKWATDNFKLIDSEYNAFTEHIINKNLNPLIEFLNDLVEYMNDFVDRFDERYQETILTKIQEWYDNGELEELINSSLDTKYHEMDDRLTEQVTQTDHLLFGSVLYEPPTASSEWATFTNTRQLNMTSDEFLDLFYNIHLGSHEGVTVTKNSRGKDESGQYDLWEYVYTPQHSKGTLLYSSGMHAYELAASFGLAHFFKHVMDDTIQHPFVKDIRDYTIKIIPIINPWGFNQTPDKVYGNSNGVNINRNFDTSTNLWETFPTIPATPEDEFNYKGTEPYSESETRILRDWAIENNHAKFWIDCHTGVWNSAGDNWIYYMSQDPLSSNILSALDSLENRIQNKYNKTPTKTVNVDRDDVIRLVWAQEQGISGFTLEQSTRNVVWSGDINNEGPDITEYEVTLWTYSSYMLGVSSEGFVSKTNQSINTLELQLRQLLSSGLTIAYDSFDRPNKVGLGTTTLGGRTWENRFGQMAIVDGKATADAGGVNELIIDAKVPNYTVEVDIDWDSHAGIALRYVSNNRFVLARINATSLTISRYENSLTTITTLGNYPFDPVKNQTYRLKVVVNGEDIDVYLDDERVIQAKENQLIGNTFVGIKTHNDTVSTFDNFTVRL